MTKKGSKSKTNDYLCKIAEFDGIIRENNGLKQAYFVKLCEESHAGFIEQLPDGTLLVAWFTGKREGLSDVSIVMSRLKYGDNKWTEGKFVSWHKYNSNQNPVLYYDKYIDRVRLFHTSQLGRDVPKTDSMVSENCIKVYQLISKDNIGEEWDKAEVLFDKMGPYTKDRIIELDHKYFMLPIYMKPGHKSTHYSVIKYHDRDDEKWTSCDIPNSIKLVQPSIIKYGTDNEPKLRAFFRNRDLDVARICYMDSSDLGITWTELTITKYVNGNCGIATCLLKNGPLLIAYTNNDKSSKRTPLSIAVSYDMGDTYTTVKDVMPYEKNTEEHVYKNAEFSYPSILQTPDQQIHMVYTYNRMTMCYLSFDLEWLLNVAPDSVGINKPPSN